MKTDVVCNCLTTVQAPCEEAKEKKYHKIKLPIFTLSTGTAMPQHMFYAASDLGQMLHKTVADQGLHVCHTSNRFQTH